MTPTWFEHATFWSGVRRATVAPRSPTRLTSIQQNSYLQWLVVKVEVFYPNKLRYRKNCLRMEDLNRFSWLTSPTQVQILGFWQWWHIFECLPQKLHAGCILPGRRETLMLEQGGRANVVYIADSKRCKRNTKCLVPQKGVSNFEWKLWWLLKNINILVKYVICGIRTHFFTIFWHRSNNSPILENTSFHKPVSNT